MKLEGNISITEVELAGEGDIGTFRAERSKTQLSGIHYFTPA